MAFSVQQFDFPATTAGLEGPGEGEMTLCPSPGVANAALLGRVYRPFQARSGDLLTLADLEAGK